MARRDGASRDLLFGLLALQNGMITRDMLVAAFAVWTVAGERRMADLLVEQGALSPARRDLLDALTSEHLAAHGGDPERSLAALDLGASSRESLAHFDHPDIASTLVGSAATARDGDATRTLTHSVGAATGDGQRFRLLRPHATGGLGAVFVATDTELHREVALKQILDSHADEPASRQRFLLEAEVTGSLEHPGIVPVYGLGAYSDGRPYYAMRFIRGDSLKDAIKRFHADRGSQEDPGRRSLGLRMLLRRFNDVCNAVDYAHSRGVIHRDLKPSNIVLGPHGETLVVDWGLAKITGRSDVGPGDATLKPDSARGTSETLPGSALGTPAYMSPEQAAGELDRLGPRSDVYSLGATLYCLLTGRAPFGGKDVDAVLRAVREGDFPRPRQLDPTLDPALEAVCLKAMATTPADRYATPRALADDVERWAADEAVGAWREPPARRARRWARRNRTAVAGAAAALVAGVVGLAAVAGVQARAGAVLARAYEATRHALADTRAAQSQTKAALEHSERNLYLASLSLAEREWSGRRIAGTEQFLAQCPPGLRRWEWRHLDALCRSGRAGLAGHEGAVRALAFSPDGVTLASAGSDGVVRLWDVRRGRTRLRLAGHPAAVTALAFSPDGRRLASGSLDGVVRLWDAADGRWLRDLPGHRGEVSAVAFHPTRPELAVGTGTLRRPEEAGEIRVWQAETGQSLRSLAGLHAAVNCVAYSPDGRLLASAGEDRTIALWDDRDGTPTRTLSLAPAGAAAPRIADRVLAFRDLRTGRETPLTLHIASAQRVAFSGDGKLLAAAVADGTVRRWDVSTWKEGQSLAAHVGAVYGLALSPSGKEVASAGMDRVVKVWSVATGAELNSYLGHLGQVNALAYSPDGEWLASGDDDGSIKLWRPPQRQDTYLFTGLSSSAYGVAFSPDGRALAAGTGDLFQLWKPGEVKIWDVASRTELRTLRGHRAGVGCVAYSPVGNRLASASADGTVRIWDVATGAEVRVLRGHQGVVFNVAWSPDGRRIASCSGNLLIPGAPGEIKLWDAETGEERSTARDHQGAVGSLAFSRDGRWLASGSLDKTVKIRDAATGRTARTLAGFEPGAYVLAFSPDSKRLAVGCGSILEPEQPCDVSIRDAGSGEPVRTLRAHSQQVTGVAYSPDGARLVSTSRDGTVRMWDTETGQQVCALKPSSQYVDCIAFSPDGQRVATGNWNATVNLWEAPGPAAGN